MEVSGHLEKMIASLKKTWELKVKYDSSANLDEFLDMAMQIAEVEIQHNHSKEAIELAAEAETEQEFDRVFRESNEIDCDDTTKKRHQLYRTFEQFARDLANKKLLTSSKPVTQTTVSNDMEITESNHAIDPITKGPLIRPVRNRQCNHIYGYQSVMDSLVINQRLRCPMFGCSNKNYIIEQDLVEL